MRFLLAGLLVVLLSACSTESNTAKQAAKTAQTFKPINLLVEAKQQPLNVHQRTPGLSWQSTVTRQSAYQIQVASSSDQLTSDTADLWDSGKIDSRRSLNIAYRGKTLTSSERAYWRVRIWRPTDADANPVPGPWSDVQFWNMGLLQNFDWQAKWVQVAKPTIATPSDAIIHWTELAGTVQNIDGSFSQLAIEKLLKMPTATKFRKVFHMPKSVIKATLHSTAAGYYEVFINGKKVEDRIMDPGQTDFDKRILYNSDDVTTMLQNGNNAIAVHLGSGWYHENVAFSKIRSLAYGRPAFITQLDLEFSDGTTTSIISDSTWLTHSSPIVKEGIFSGEVYDANLEIANWNSIESPTNVDSWQRAEELASWPTKTLEPQLLPPVRAVEKLNPKKIYQPEKGVWVFDFGQNFTGIPTLRLDELNLKQGQTVNLRYAEWADSQGNISQRSGGGFATLLNQVDSYIASGDDSDSWRPTFTWHGFRYVEVTGLTSAPSLSALSAELVKSDVKQAGTFISSDQQINRIHQTALWTYRSNLVSLPMDCPIRERAGWTGDAHASLVAGNYNFNMQNFWEKYLGDFKTATFVAPAIVPGKRTLGRKIDWAVAEVFITWQHYQHHQDEQLLQEQYESLMELMNFGQSELSDYLIEKGYGDWCDPVRKPGMERVGGRGTPQQTQPAITSTALFAHAANLMSTIANVVGNKADESKFEQLYQNISTEFHRAFYDPEAGHYGSQTADAMALRFGITPQPLRQSVADALNRDVLENWGGHSSVGALGQTWLYLALSDYGHADTAFRIFTAKGYPGFDYLFNDLNGTSLWERKGGFDPTGDEAPLRSLSHPFHAGYDGWFYQGLGGIKPLPEYPGFQEFTLQPVFPTDLQSADVTYRTGYGVIESRWMRAGNVVIWNINVPANSTAHVWLPEKPMQKLDKGTYTFEINVAE